MKKPFTFLIISTEPAPYKTDLYNAFCELKGWSVDVFYAMTRSWEQDEGHDFRLLPERKYHYSSRSGKGLWGGAASALNALSLVNRLKPDLMLICTMRRLPYVASILIAILKRTPFVVWDDHFNTAAPFRGGMLGRTARYILRRLVFSYGRAILICGRAGWETAIKVGCPADKLLNFPYVVDLERINKLAQLAGRSEETFNVNLPILFFSGRMIERKGLPVLLDAARRLRDFGKSFLLLVEGEGPLRKEYSEMANALGLKNFIIFVGFSQMDRHAYYLSIADIVIVPSTEDPWGIVVHEAMLMGKPVCASDKVGSAVELIENGVNGLIFLSEDASGLANKLMLLLNESTLRKGLGVRAKRSAEDLSPTNNVNSLLSFLGVEDRWREEA